MAGEITDNARSEREDSHPLSDDQVMRQREVIVVLESSGPPLQAGSGEGVSAPSNPVPNQP